MKETKAALVEARNENQRLENKTIGQIVKVREAEHKLEELKLKLLEKDISIKDLTNQINSGQKSEKIKYLEEKLERCEKEMSSTADRKKTLEESLNKLNSANLVVYENCCILPKQNYKLYGRF